MNPLSSLIPLLVLLIASALTLGLANRPHARRPRNILSGGLSYGSSAGGYQQTGGYQQGSQYGYGYNQGLGGYGGSIGGPVVPIGPVGAMPIGGPAYGGVPYGIGGYGTGYSSSYGQGYQQSSGYQGSSAGYQSSGLNAGFSLGR